MKRILMLALVALMVFGATANAAEFKAKGSFAFDFQFTDNLNWMPSDTDGQNEDDFTPEQRFRMEISIIASENLKGVFYIESNCVWGNNNAATAGGDGQLDTDGVNIEVKRSYIEWNVPQTDLMVKVGLAGLGLPGIYGHPVLKDIDVALVQLTYPINDMFAVSLLWARPFDTVGGVNVDSALSDEMDVFALVVPITGDGFTIVPYGIVAFIGETLYPAGNPWGLANGALAGAYAASADTNNNYTAWWLGLHAAVDMFDPLYFALDFAWGTANTGDEAFDLSGWIIVGTVEYALDFMTIGLVGWYASGEDDDATNGFETMPQIDSGFEVNYEIFEGSGFLGTGGNYSANALGTWGLALVLKDITFIEDLTHELILSYVHGTNDEDSVVVPAAFAAGFGCMGTNDAAWEIDFKTTYNIYENLSVFFELSWATMMYDDDDHIIDTDDLEDLWVIGVGLRYNF